MQPVNFRLKESHYTRKIKPEINSREELDEIADLFLDALDDYRMAFRARLRDLCTRKLRDFQQA